MRVFRFDVREEYGKELDALMRDTGAKTKTDVMNEALTFYQWGVRQRQQGRAICAVDDATGKATEVVMPGLDAAGSGGARG